MCRSPGARVRERRESYASTSQSVLDSTARFYAMTPALTGSWDGVIEISFYGARSSDAVTDSGTSTLPLECAPQSEHLAPSCAGAPTRSAITARGVPR